VKVNWASGIDMKTGRPIETDVSKNAREGKKVTVYPSVLGGKNWEPMSFNPQTGLAYANTLAFGGHYKTEPATYKQGEWYLGMDLTDVLDFQPGPRGHLKAIDPMTGKAKWEAPSDIPRFSGVLSTAGGVVFTGALTGEFEAFDADTGKKLWHFQTGSGIEGQPVTWQQEWRAVCGDHQRLWRRLLDLLGRRAARQRAARRLIVGVRAQAVIKGCSCSRK
jgi:alcohol dehydrogenase (cytochrome c)